MSSIRVLSVFLTIMMLIFASPGMSLEWGELEGKIKSTIEGLNLGKHSIETKYSSGKLTVSGYVSSEKEKEKVIEQLGHLQGISEVDNQLTVGKESNGSTDDSVTVRRAVLNEIRQLKGLGTYSLEVRPSDSNEILLEGKVASYQDKTRIEDAARRHIGTGKLTSNLTIKALSEPDLAANVLGALKKESDIDLTGVSVKANKEGIVTFSGSRPNHREIDRILSIANMVDGVTEVKSEMTIK